MTKIDKGYASAYFANSTQRMQAVFEDCHLLVGDLTMDAVAPLLPLLEKVAGSGRALLIIATSVEGEALATLTQFKLRGTISSCAVPVKGPDHKALLDAAAAVGGTQILSTTGALPELELSDLGRVKHAVVTPKATHLSQEPIDAEKVYEDETNIDFPLPE